MKSGCELSITGCGVISFSQKIRVWFANSSAELHTHGEKKSHHKWWMENLGDFFYIVSHEAKRSE
jgi:hypothetical protein